MPRGAETDKAAWIRLLEDAGVAYVLVGGFAAELYGSSRVTYDIDVVPQWDDENLERLCAALRSVGAQTASGPKAAGEAITPALLREREILNWNSEIGAIDTLVGIPNSNGEPVGFGELLARGEPAQLGPVTVILADLDDIITSKRFANRPKDQEALPELERIRMTHMADSQSDRDETRSEPRAQAE